MLTEKIHAIKEAYQCGFTTPAEFLMAYREELMKVGAHKDLDKKLNNAVKRLAAEISRDLSEADV